MTKGRWELVTGAVALLVFLVLWFLVGTGLSQGLDAQLALAINGFSLGPLNSLMILASEYGREYFWIPVVAVMFLFGNRETKLLALELAALFVVGIVAGEIMKVVFFRARPYEVVSGIVTRIPADTDSSFPSGHALIVSIGAAFVIVKFRSRIISSLLAIEAALVCYSRVYVGAHYPLDVVSGIFLGLSIVMLGLFILESGRLTALLRRISTLVARLIGEGPLKL